MKLTLDNNNQNKLQKTLSSRDKWNLEANNKWMSQKNELNRMDVNNTHVYLIAGLIQFNSFDKKWMNHEDVGQYSVWKWKKQEEGKVAIDSSWSVSDALLLSSLLYHHKYMKWFMNKLVWGINIMQLY